MATEFTAATIVWRHVLEQVRQRSARSKLAGRADLDAPPLDELAALDEAGFRARFAGGPIKRIGHARFLRNVMIAGGNSADRSLIAIARKGH